jgi:hypothetical protein
MLPPAFLALISIIIIPDSALLDAVFSNVNDLRTSISDYPMVAPDNYHPPLINLDFKLTCDCQPTLLNPRHNHGQADYMLLYNTLSNCDWSCILNKDPVDSAVYNFTASVSEAINKAIPFVKPKNSTFPHWFPKSLKKLHQEKNQFFKKYKKSKSDYYYSIFSYYHKLVKITIKADRFDWLKTIDNNLKTQPKHFWKYISKFKKNDQSAAQIEVGDNVITEPQFTTEAFVDHFSSIFNSSSSVNTLNNSLFTCSDFFNIPYFSD